MLDNAHKHSTNNKTELLGSDACGCFYCKTIFTPTEIKEWVDHDQTALCPYCHVDSIIGFNSEYPITQEFLTQMYTKYFTLKPLTEWKDDN